MLYRYRINLTLGLHINPFRSYCFFHKHFINLYSSACKGNFQQSYCRP
nr:MAG TPA: hypothetical protein [Caudoviricetes sp.]